MYPGICKMRNGNRYVKLKAMEENFNELTIRIALLLKGVFYFLEEKLFDS